MLFQCMEQQFVLMFGMSLYGPLHFRLRNPRFSDSSSIPLSRLPIGAIPPPQPRSDHFCGVFGHYSWNQMIPRGGATGNRIAVLAPLAFGFLISLAADVWPYIPVYHYILRRDFGRVYYSEGLQRDGQKIGGSPAQPPRKEYGRDDRNSGKAT